MNKIVAAGADFATTRQNPQALFVDKTLFIREFLESGVTSSLITRPRRFGKTFNLSMLHCFLSLEKAKENQSLFEGTKIISSQLSNSQPCLEHQGRYPVIHFSLKDVRCQNLPEALTDIEGLMQDLYNEFTYLLESPQLGSSDLLRFKRIIGEQATAYDLKHSLRELTRLLHLHHGIKPIVLIDEYDTPIHEAYCAKEPYHEQLLSFYKIWLGGALKSNPHLGRGLLTGILRVALINLFSGMNSVPVYSMLSSPYAEHFGFNESEVQLLLEQTNLCCHAQTLKAWYNGYRIGNTTCYNPWSVLNCIDNKGEPQTYWSGSGDHGTLAKALIRCSDSSVLEGLELLLRHQSLEVPIDELTLFNNLGTSAASVWGLMLYAGYLNCLQRQSVDQRTLATVSIPNHEVLTDIRAMVRSWISYSAYPTTRAHAYANETTLIDSLLLALDSGNIQHLENLLQTFMDEVASFHDFHGCSEERFYHVFLLGMMVVLREHFTVASNKEAGLGRFDLALVSITPPHKGILIELKRARHPDSLQQTAQQALQQITDNRYDTLFKQQRLTQTLHLGMAFYGKQVALAHHWQSTP